MTKYFMSDIYNKDRLTIYAKTIKDAKKKYFDKLGYMPDIVKIIDELGGMLQELQTSGKVFCKLEYNNAIQKYIITREESGQVWRERTTTYEKAKILFNTFLHNTSKQLEKNLIIYGNYTGRAKP